MNPKNSGERHGGWIGTLWRNLQGRGVDDEPVREATEHVVQLADPIIRQAKRYQQVLHAPIMGAMAHFRSLTEAIPGPVALNRNQYHDNPLVKALFASPDELEEVLRLSPEVNRFRKQGYAGEVMAMMTMQQNERTIFGTKQQGELLLRDVRQQTIDFSDHRIVAVAADLEATKDGIVNRGLEVLATFAMERITTLRARKAELQGTREYLKGMMKILGGKSHMQEMFAAPTMKNREELQKAEKALAEVDLELEELRKQISLPEHSLGYLEEIIRKSEALLVVRNQSFRLNWMNVRVDDATDREAHEITLAEFSIEEVLRRSAVLVTFPLTAPAG
ncbi:MAG: hypothetical protein JZU65_07280 [Chlorobium sp.]|nr:hypothetical protein [Chlorobium sp.]